MSVILSIAARNVFRHKRRTLLTVITMAVSLGFFIWMDSYMSGLDAGSIRSLADFSESGLRISTAAYAERRVSSPLAEGLPDPGKTLEAVRGLPGVLAACPRTPFTAQVSGPAGDKAVQALIVDPALDPGVFKLTAALKGEWFARDGAADPQIILGAALAKQLDLDVGDWLTLYAKARYDTNRAQGFKLIGLVDSSDPNLNSGAAYISYKDADAFLDAGGLVTELRAAVRNPGSMKGFLAATNKARDAARALLPGCEVASLDDISASFLAISSSKRKSAYMLIVILLFISAVGIVNTILMSIYSRVREIGVLGAFGMKRGEITSLFLAEGAIIGLLGCCGGVALGALLDLQAVYQGMALDKLAGKIDTAGIAVWGTLKGEWNPQAIVFGFFFGMAVALLSSWIPARRAGKMRITRALRAE
jgi:putative ABC transport system permease protein